jgi:hypothetical protein
MAKKTSEATYDAFKRIFKGGRTPVTLYTDRGLEFSMTGIEIRNKKRGKVRQDFYEKLNVKRLETSDHKAAIVERFNRTIRQKIQRYLTWRSSGRRITDLPDLVDSYNDTIHPIHSKTPREVYNMNEKEQSLLYEGRSRTCLEKSSMNKLSDLTLMSATMYDFLTLKVYSRKVRIFVAGVTKFIR